MNQYYLFIPVGTDGEPQQDESLYNSAAYHPRPYSLQDIEKMYMLFSMSTWINFFYKTNKTDIF